MSMSMRQRHGWVVPLPSGAKARCGGPGMCSGCQEELREMYSTLVANQQPLGKEFAEALSTVPYAR